jgi:hypothetical protein
MRTWIFSLVLVLIAGLVIGHVVADGTIKTNLKGFGLLGLGRLRLGLWSFRPNRVYFRLEMR